MQALMVHGAGGGGWEWNVWRRVFTAAGVDTLAPDLMSAPNGPGATVFEDYRAQVAAAALALVPPRVLVGASLGGLLALAVAAEVEVEAVVLVNPLPPAPLAARLPARGPWPAVVPWGRDATLEATRRAMPDADDAACLYASRRWRDESGRVLAQAHDGIAVGATGARVLLIASDADADVPPALSAALSHELGATFIGVSASHVGPLLGRAAAAHATQALTWLNASCRTA